MTTPTKGPDEPSRSVSEPSQAADDTAPPLPRSWKEPSGDALPAGATGSTARALDDPNRGAAALDLQDLPAALAERFSDFRLLGEGGMGAVYRARDRRLLRDVAIKFLRGGPETTSRLLREARSQARLEHENVCGVYEVGVAGGQRFIVMQLIDGRPLGEIAARMTLEQKVRAVRQVADALHEAHRLGLVHRDVKPGNILVEEGADAAYRPYLMDFGLARDMGAEGATITGAIAGTPSYMAPEQARGDTRAIDRRTDVYGLGATLHASLCGRAPFSGRGMNEILDRVLHDDAPLLRSLVPSVPEDIEAVVARCLEKDPRKRYESARALGEDLQRYLDGEPVRARRAGLAYVLARKARRHRGKLALSAAALAAFAAFGGAWLQSRRAAADQARLSRELGEDVKEMELFMRNAYGLPLHDVDRERAVVRARLADIEQRTAAAGPAGEGPGHYALGRGYLVLRQPETALTHLRRAESAGYASPELRYALGLALGEVYRKKLEEANRIDSPSRKEARLRQIEALYKAPALESLRASLGARLESPAYAEGLIAYHEGRNVEALSKAREAFAQAPWMYEAKKLEGDARFAEGSKWRHDAAFDHDKMEAEFTQAEAAYRAAESIATSDPGVYEAECDLWAQRILSSAGRLPLLRIRIERAKAVCAKAIEASPAGGSGYIKRAFAAGMAARAEDLPTGERDGLANEAIRIAEEAARHNPDDAMANYLMGTSLTARSDAKLDEGIADRDALERGIAAYDAALRADPTFVWAWHESCAAEADLARTEAWRGRDFETMLKRAVRRCERALEIDPGAFNGHVNRAYALCARSELRADAGLSPGDVVVEVAKEASAMRAASAESFMPAYDEGLVHLGAARQALAAGQDPRPSLDLAAKDLRELARSSAPADAVSMTSGKLDVLRARDAVRRGEDPRPILEKARASLAEATAQAPGSQWDRLWSAHAEIVALRWATAKGTLDAAAFRAARAPLLPLLDRERDAPHIYEALAEIDAIEAAFLLGRRESATATLDHGFAMVEKALSRNPKSVSALATKATLERLRSTK